MKCLYIGVQNNVTNTKFGYNASYLTTLTQGRKKNIFMQTVLFAKIFYIMLLCINQKIQQNKQKNGQIW